MWLFIAFLLVPLIEITLFIQIGGLIGLWPTLLTVVLTAIAGTFLVRQQGFATLAKLQSSFSDMRDPTEPPAHGAMILFAGALLLTPGFFTDAIGLSLMIPAVRQAAFNGIKSRIEVQHFGGPTHDPQGRHPQGREDVIEAEYYEVEETEPETSRKHGPARPSEWTKH